MNRYIKNGKVAVLYSPGYGAGWTTWNEEYPEMLFSPEIAEALDNKADYQTLEEISERLFPGAFLGGLEQLKIEWVEPGSQIRIDEYDGNESVYILNDVQWPIA